MNKLVFMAHRSIISALYAARRGVCLGWEMAVPLSAVSSGTVVPLSPQTYLFWSQIILAQAVSIAERRGGCGNSKFCYNCF